MNISLLRPDKKNLNSFIILGSSLVFTRILEFLSSLMVIRTK